MLSTRPGTHHLPEAVLAMAEAVGSSPREVMDGLHDHKGLVITLSQMHVDSITKFLPSVRPLAFRGRDLLEQCSFTGGRHSSLAMSVFLMVKASST